MAITNQDSSEYADQTALPVVKLENNVAQSEVEAYNFSFVQSGVGDDGSSFNIQKISGGKFRVLSYRLNHETIASGVLELGFGAHTDIDGKTAVVADPDFFVGSIDISSGTEKDVFSNKTLETFDGVTLTGTITAAALSDADIFNGVVYICRDAN